MTALPLALSSFGLVTGVGLDAPSTCAAIRSSIDNFQETRFMDNGGEWIMGSEVQLEQPWRGKTKLVKMASIAIQECLSQESSIQSKETPLVLCLSEPERVGRVIDDDNQLFLDLCEEVGMEFHEKSRVVAQGHVGVGTALLRARKLIEQGVVQQVLIAGVDSLLVGQTLSALEEEERLLSSKNSDGFIPGEGAGAFLVRACTSDTVDLLVCQGLGFGMEKAHVNSEEPLRADGLTTAIKNSLADAGCGESILEFKITDISGEQYYFKEASLAFSRIDRTKRTEFDIWHPADCVGELGAGLGVVMFAVLKFACEKSYSKGTDILAHLGSDDGKRSSMIFSWRRMVSSNG